ncbi:MAG: hypothetical protein K6U02_00870 [Firmicutes bacterium]|nr:hypothetical protein [Bacillota bacterium]
MLPRVPLPSFEQRKGESRCLQLAAEPPGELAPLHPASCPVLKTGPGQKRGIRTVKALVRQLPFRMPPAQYYFCTAPDCDVVYFASDPAAPVFRRGDLLVAVAPSRPQAPDTSATAWHHRGVHLGESRTVESVHGCAEHRGRSESGNCACELKNPSGRCCLGEITQAERKALTQRGTP